MRRSRGRSWFAALRREGKLFAFVAGLALVFAMLQPLVPAQAAVADLGVICSVHADGISGENGVPGEHRDCPCCVFGHICGGLPLLAKALTTHTQAFAPPSTIRHALAVPPPVAAQNIASGPPGIRAPPFF